jgi:hypothetical protein
VDATVLEVEKKIYGIYRTADGRQLICINPISEEELIAYRRQPDTFFGVTRKQTKKAKDSLDLFDFFYESYRKTARQRLLEFVKDRPDFDALKKLSDEELLISYCEGLVYSAMEKK